MKNFEKSLSLTLKFEGGYVDNRFDPGGATNKGITIATLAKYRRHPVTKNDVKLLSGQEAADIYNLYFWKPLMAEQMPSGVDMFLFDYAVNSGPAHAVKALQSILQFPQDGVINEATLHAVDQKHPSDIVHALAAKRLEFLQQLRTFAVFGRGWKTRIEAVTSASIALSQ